MLAWLLALVGLGSQWFWARALVHSDLLLVTLTALGLGGGAISLSMLWQGLLGMPITPQVTLSACLLCGALGWLYAQRVRSAPEHYKASYRLPAQRAVVALLILTAALCLFNAAYWFYNRDDAIAIYARFGKQVAMSGALPLLGAQSLYEAYPMFMPMLYAFAHQLSGTFDDSLAAFLGALFSVGVLGAAYALGRELFNAPIGLSAALLLALAPLFTDWASAGYTDLPCGFFYGMSAVFAARWARRGTWQDALLAGIMAGLAAWMKNSGLLIVGAFGAWFAYRLLVERQTLRRELRGAVLVSIGFLAICGVWYIRNLVLTGALVPPTGWTWLAQRTLSTLFPYASETGYLFVGYALTLGVWFTAARAIVRQHALSVLLTAFYLPFFGVWWLFFSYDDRFLLALSALVAVMAAETLRVCLVPLLRRLPQLHRTMLMYVALLSGFFALYTAIDYKAELLRLPFASAELRWRVVFGARYDVAQFLKTLPAGAQVWTSDHLLFYHAEGVKVITGGLPSAPQLNGYIVLAPSESLPTQFADRQPIYVHKDWRVYAIQPE
ncbi:MAG: glycosyltransferase family 39 protein [Anaerolineae bacterium]|nr:glycosyltransferase family 39 protein [Anaerolineae bacterium]